MNVTLGLMTLTLLAGLAGCKPDPEQSKDGCGADALQDLVGRPVDVFDETAQDSPVRVITPGSAITMDHRPERLNLDLDETGAVSRVWCG